MATLPAITEYALQPAERRKWEENTPSLYGDLAEVADHFCLSVMVRTWSHGHIQLQGELATSSCREYMAFIWISCVPKYQDPLAKKKGRTDSGTLLLNE